MEPKVGHLFKMNYAQNLYVHCSVRVELQAFKSMKKGHLEGSSALIVDVV